MKSLYENEGKMKHLDSHQFLSFETYARNSSNYYQHMVDGKSQHDYEISWSDAAVAAGAQLYKQIKN